MVKISLRFMFIMLIFLCESIHNAKKAQKLVLFAAKEICLEVNAKINYSIVVSREHSAGQLHNIMMDNKSFGSVAKLKYLGTKLKDKNQNGIPEEIKSRLNSGNVGYHSAQNLLCAGFVSRNINIQICRNIRLPVILYGCETWFPTLTEEHRLRTFENRGLRKVFGPKGDEVTGE